MSISNDERTREMSDLARTLPIVFRLMLIGLITDSITSDVRAFTGGLFDITGYTHPSVSGAGILPPPPPSIPAPSMPAVVGGTPLFDATAGSAPPPRHELSALGGAGLPGA